MAEVHNNIGNSSENNNEILKLSERERDRQRYNKLKERVYAHKTRHPKENNNNNNIIDKNALNKEDFLDFNGLQQFIETNNSNKSDFQFDSSILNISYTDTNPKFSTVASSSSTSFSNNNIPSINNQTKSNKSKGGKSNNLYTQILNSINTNTNINTLKETQSSSLLSKTNDSRNKEIADKKKRRSAATMRCREKKRNQFQKKEQYINYLKNHVLFLDGLISHMGNEINWLRKSYIAQHGEQSLRDVYIENGLKNVDFNAFPGSVSLTSSSLLVNPLNQNSNFKPSTSTNLPLNTSNIISSPSLQLNKNDDISKLANIPLNINSPSLVQSDATPQNTINLDINNSGFDKASLNSMTPSKEILPTPSQSIPTSSTTTTKAPDANQNLNFLNGFLNLSKEQRDLLINFLKKQDQVQKPESSNDFVNISENNIDATNFTKHNSLLSTIQNNSTTATTTAAQLSSLQQNLLNTLNQHQNLQSINFSNTTNVFTSSANAIVSTHPTTTEGALQSTDLSNPTSSNNDNAQNIDKMIYYI